jgi:hypothetical protein
VRASSLHSCVLTSYLPAWLQREIPIAQTDNLETLFCNIRALFNIAATSANTSLTFHDGTQDPNKQGSPAEFRLATADHWTNVLRAADAGKVVTIVVSHSEDGGRRKSAADDDTSEGE